MIRHYFPGTDPLGLTFHQTFTLIEDISQIETAKAGETDHRANVERMARRMRLTDG